MQFEKLSARNFLSYQKLDLSFTGPGLTLIEGFNSDEGGSNASGKSGIWDVISWGLFGTTIRKAKSDEIIHRQFKKDCVVSVVFNQSGKRVNVLRFRKHTGKDSSGLIYGDRLIVKIDDRVEEKGTVADTQEFLLNFLGIDFDLFKCTVLFGQADSFNFVNETDQKQKEILSKIRRIDFDTYLKETRKKIRSTEDAVTSAMNNKEWLVKLVGEGPENYDNEISTWEKENKEEVKKKESLISKLKSEMPEVPDVKELVDLRVQLETARVENEKKYVEFEGKVRVLSGKIREFGDKTTEIKNLKGACPVCERPITEGLAAGLLTTYKEKFYDAKVLHEKVKSRIEIIKGTIEEHRQKIKRLDEKIGSAKAAKQEAEKIRQTISHLEEELKGLRKEENPWLAKAAKAKKQHEDKKDELKKVEKELSGFQQLLPYLIFWEIAFSDKGIKSFLFDSLCGTLTSKANQYLGILSGGAISISFDTQKLLKSGELREKFECNIQADGEVVPYHLYSGAEKTSISLSVDMALADLMCDYYANKFNIVVFDERDIYMDRIRRQFYLELLRERAKTQAVFVVSHDSELKGMFDDILTIRKKNGVSCVE
jgi:DNA repair exonuclease SbcCD ATPase subunit